jgi:hypothetical protein
MIFENIPRTELIRIAKEQAEKIKELRATIELDKDMPVYKELIVYKEAYETLEEQTRALFKLNKSYQLLVGDMDLKEFYEYHYEDFVKNSPVDNS